MKIAYSVLSQLSHGAAPASASIAFRVLTPSALRVYFPAVSSSNTICRIFLEASVLKAWKRASGPAIDQLELAARAAPIQALIDTLLGGSFEESLKMFGFDYFSSPFRTMNASRPATKQASSRRR